MKILENGHVYELDCLDHDGTVTLTFVKRVGEKYPGNDNAHSGTTTQEVLRALIQRTNYVNSQAHSRHNETVLDNLRDALVALEERAAERHGKKVLEKHYLSEYPEQIEVKEDGHWHWDE